MRIAILGMGNVGSVLGRRWAEGGHDVVFGSRRPGDATAQETAEKLRARLASIADACAKAEVVVLAVPWRGVRDALSSAGNLAGKVLLDCTCPLTSDLGGLEIGTTTSGGEVVAHTAEGARVVKIFCTTGSDNMANPRYGATKLTLPYCGDDPAAKEIAAQLASELGFDPIDVGPLSAARALEPLGLLWVILAYKQKRGTGFSLNLIRRDGDER
jgi:predicted dinucleotide-binding enzyme